MKPLKYDGYKRGLYIYFADNHDNVKSIFSSFFKTGKPSIRITYRREDLELMVLVEIESLKPDAMIVFTINRLDEYRFNYDNEILLQNIIDNFKLGNRCKKIGKIKNRICDDK